MSVFIDTNVLVYAISADSPFFERARDVLSVLEEEEGGVWISRQVIRELSKILMYIAERKGGYDLKRLINTVDECASAFYIAEDSESVTLELYALITKYNVRSKQVHDTNIVATMRVYGIDRILTANVSDFEPFKDAIEVIHFDTATPL